MLGLVGRNGKFSAVWSVPSFCLSQLVQAGNVFTGAETGGIQRRQTFSVKGQTENVLSIVCHKVCYVFFVSGFG